MICYIYIIYHTHGLVQDCSNSIVNTMELLQSCTKPSIYSIYFAAAQYTHLLLVNKVCSIFCEFKDWSTFYLWCDCLLCSTVLYQIVLQQFLTILDIIFVIDKWSIISWKFCIFFRPLILNMHILSHSNLKKFVIYQNLNIKISEEIETGLIQT